MQGKSSRPRTRRPGVRGRRRPATCSFLPRGAAAIAACSSLTVTFLSRSMRTASTVCINSQQERCHPSAAPSNAYGLGNRMQPTCRSRCCCISRSSSFTLPSSADLLCSAIALRTDIRRSSSYQGKQVLASRPPAPWLWLLLCKHQSRNPPPRIPCSPPKRRLQRLIG